MISFGTTLTVILGSDPFNYLEAGSNEIKGGRREANGLRGAESGRAGYGKREVMISLSHHHPPPPPVGHTNLTSPLGFHKAKISLCRTEIYSNT